MNEQTGPQPGQGHPWGPPSGQSEQGSAHGTPSGGQPQHHQPQPSGQQQGPWGAPGGQGQFGGGPQPGPYAGVPAGGPGQHPGARQGQHHGQQGQAPGQYQGQADGTGQGAGQPGASTVAAPTPGRGSMSTGDVVRIVLHVLALLLVVLGISIDMDGRDSVLWGDTWAWAGFATLMALAQCAALLPKTALSGAGWTIGAIGAGGLLLFWTLLMLPMISTNMAFLVTLGTACAAGGVLLSPDRKL